MMSAAGIDSVRIWLPWSTVEARRGQYVWETVDATVRQLAEANLSTLPFLLGSPVWAAHADGFGCKRFGCIPFPPAGTMTRRAFAAFAAAAVRRYGPDGTFWQRNAELPYKPIRSWQIWNEPNLVSYYKPAIDPRGYARLVRAAAAQIHRADRAAEVILAGLSGNRTNEEREATGSYLRRFYAVPGTSASVDGVAVHPYHPEPAGVYEQVRIARRVAGAADDRFELWITELGWASAGKRHWKLVTTRSRQAELLDEVVGGLLAHRHRWDLRAVYWFAWRDTEAGESVCGWCPWAGLLDRGGEPKPAFTRLRALAGD
jgi:hypothetical protein